MSYGYTLTDPESAFLAAYVAQLEALAATLANTPEVRQWRDGSQHQTYPAFLVHVALAIPSAENNGVGGPLYDVLITIAAETHIDEQPPASGTTPVAGDPDGEDCRTMIAEARANIAGSPPVIANAEELQTRIMDPEDTSEGAINHMGFTVRETVQLT